MTGTSRPLDSGRRDALGRVVKVSGQDAAGRADAPLPPGSDAGFDTEALIGRGIPDAEWVQPDGKTVSTRTPWGAADTGYKYATGVNFYNTPGHGGFKLSDSRNAEVPVPFQRVNGWYEEDCDWAAVAYTFPELFPREQVANAIDSLRNWYPHQWQQVTGETVTAEQSTVVAEQEFKARHADDQIVVAAIGSNTPTYGFDRDGNRICDELVQEVIDGTSSLHPAGEPIDRDILVSRIISEVITRGGSPNNGLDRGYIHGLIARPFTAYLDKRDDGRFDIAPAGDMPIIRSAPAGMVLVHTATGGDRGNDGRRTFLVPGDEYRDRDRFGFVIDETRHQEVKVAE